MDADAPWDNERARLDALDELRILDTDPDDAFDAIARLAAQTLDVPIALVSLVAEHRQWFKARVGLEPAETPRQVSFCSHAIANGRGVFVIEDAIADRRFRDNPLVTGPPHIRAYAGAPMRTPGGQLLGTVCVIDSEPRTFAATELAVLTSLADQAVLEMRLRREALSIRDLGVARDDAERRFHAVFDRAPSGMAVIDLDGVVAYTNRALLRLLARGTDDLIGVTIDALTHPDDREANRERVDRLLGGNAEAYELPLRLLLPDGTDISVVLTMQVAPGADGSVRFLVAEVQDRTAQVRADRERRAQLAALRSTRSQLEDAVEVRDQILAMASHDMRNPLTVIRGHSDLLTGRDGAYTADDRESIAAISRQAERLESLVDDLLALASIESGLALSPAPLGLAEVVASVAADNDSDGDVRIDVDPDLVVVADRGRLVQIVTNLIDNASRYGRPPIDITADPGPGWVDLRVEDHGPGVPDDFVPYLFEKFSRARDAVAQASRGSGLGLAIVRALARAHDGDVWYEAAGSGGAGFVLRLPSTDADEAERSEPSSGVDLMVVGGGDDLLHLLEEHQDYAMILVEEPDRILPLARRHQPDTIVFGAVYPGAPTAMAEILNRLRRDPLTTDIPLLIVQPDLPIDAAELDARIADLVERAARTEALKARNLALDHESRTDPLTGLANRRSLKTDLDRLSSFARRHGEPMAVLIIDIDRFKDINDRHGHPAGDRVLTALGETLARCQRTEDIVGRWGGDEFLVLAPGTDLDGATALAERIRSAVAAIEIDADVDDEATLTVSVGVASVGVDGVDAVAAADRALYVAKRNGRNSVAVHPED